MMKLHKLILTNIGPYAGKRELDFDLLDNSLFLITGATGAGKTYIFDSICYALYGKTSGENREPDDLKSKFAGPKDIASIDLYFEYQNKNYLIHKEPIQWRQNDRKTNGEYQMSRRSAVGAIYLLPDDKKPIISTGLEKYITDLFGLDFKQFKMTMMIAQGDFYSLINADTKKREEIFRKILNTEKLADFSKKLEDKCKEKEAEYKENNNFINTLRTGFDFEDELKNNTSNLNYDISLLIPEIEAELKNEEIKKNEIGKDLVIKKADMLKSLEKVQSAISNNNNLDNYLDTKKKMNNLELMLPEFKKKANLLLESDKASIFKQALDNYNEENNNLNNLNDSKNNLEILIKKNKELSINLKKSLDVAKKMLEENDKLIEENSKLDEKLNKISTFNKLNKEIELIDIELIKSNNNKNEINAPIDELNKEKEELEIILNGEDKNILLNNVNNNIKNIDDKITEFKKKKLIIDKYIELIDIYKANYDEYNKKNQIYLESLNEYEHYEHNYHSSLAGILAANLNDNEPCPVCGSINHPKKALLTIELSKKELDRLKGLSDNALDNKNKADKLVNKSYAELDNVVLNIKEFIPEFNEKNIYSKFEDLISNMELEKMPYLKQKEELEIYVNKYNYSKDKLKLINDKISDINKKILELDKDINSNEIKKSEILGSIKQLNDIKDLNELDLNNKKIKNNAIIIRNKNAYQTANMNYSAVEKELSGNNASLQLIISNIQTSNKKLEELNNEMNNALTNGGFESKDMALNSILPLDIYEKYKQEGSNFRVDFEATKNNLNNLIKLGYDKLERENILELEEKKNKSSEEYDLINNKYSEINNKYANNLKQFDTLNRVINMSKDIRAKYLELKQLSDVANGKVNGKKINFEVYYQLQIFDEILKVASYKFNRMSNGRYEMMAGQPKGGNGQFGLEIDVKDLYNGEVRPVSGLSGGESFQASMALALAFSEIIQFKAGGIELNSMFIDEGFGTLDNEMLESTKKTLLEIGNATNRRIGIISHIEELVRSISSKVIVTKTDKGSHFEIIND